VWLQRCRDIDDAKDKALNGQHAKPSKHLAFQSFTGCPAFFYPDPSISSPNGHPPQKFSQRNKRLSRTECPPAKERQAGEKVVAQVNP
jgi:hypothetical protein